MFEKFICPDPAYEQLKISGVTDIILKGKKKDLVRDILLDRNIGDDFRFNKARNFILSNLFKIKTQKLLMYEDLVKSERDFDIAEGMLFGGFDSFLAQHPVLLGHAVLGDNLLKYEKFGFGSRVGLEKAITGFCLGERNQFGLWNDEWTWRNAGFKNNIFRNMHGDLYVSQKDSSGKDFIDNTLFGKVRVFDSIKKAETFGFGAYQDWSQFLVSLLKYSEKIGKSDIPEISNWQEVLDEVGGTSGAYAEAFGGLDAPESHAHTLMDEELMSYRGMDDKGWPITVSNRNQYALPFFKDDKLTYFVQDEEGEFEFNFGRFFKDKRFSKAVEYNPDDLPEAMRGTLKYFARSREMIPAIMNEFNRRKK